MILVGELSSQVLSLPPDTKAMTPKSHLLNVESGLDVLSQDEAPMISLQMQVPLPGGQSLFPIRLDVHFTEHLDEGR